MRIASLIPSGTDIACALGLRESLVGRSHACDAPGTAHLPILTRSVIDSTRSPGEIDADVSRALEEGQSLYLTNRELLRHLAPDIVLTQTICDVCAVNANQAARDLPPGARLVNLAATSIDGLWEDLRAVGAASKVDAEPLIHNLKHRVAKVIADVAGRPRPRVLVLEWTEPPFLGGHWVAEMVELAGGTHVLGQAGEPSRRATWDEIAESDPEILIVAPCGYDLDESIIQAQALLTNGSWLSLPAVQTGRVYAVNATALFSRCTPATVRGIEVLAGLLHPGVRSAPLPSEVHALFQ